MRCLFAPLLFVLLLAGCKDGEPRFDTSTAAAYRQSLAAVQSALPEPERPKLMKALIQLSFAGVTDNDNPFAKLTAMANAAKHETTMLAVLSPVLHGRTGPEVIKLASDQAEQTRQRQLTAVRDEIATIERELAAGVAKATAEGALLSKIQLQGARYFWNEQGYSDEPIIAFKITNGGDKAIRKIYVRGIVETPGRSVPWLEEDFNYEISGGLEPGESQDLRLAPNRFSKWGNQDLKKRNDLVLTLTLRDVEDAAGNRVAGSTDDTERKRERLKVLREKEGKLSRGEAI